MFALSLLLRVELPLALKLTDGIQSVNSEIHTQLPDDILRPSVIFK